MRLLQRQLLESIYWQTCTFRDNGRCACLLSKPRFRYRSEKRCVRQNSCCNLISIVISRRLFIETAKKYCVQTHFQWKFEE